MKIHLISDLHLEHYEPDDTFIYDLDPEDCETLVIAGDLCPRWYESVKGFFQMACDKYEHVIYVLGNHEYYGSTYEETREKFKELDEWISNLYCLENQTLALGEKVIAGTTLWFRDTPLNPLYEREMCDFQQIPDFRSWVYVKNQEALTFLENANGVDWSADLVVTHHLPSYKSVSPRYAEEPTNLYFLCDVEGIMLDMEPKVWAHGHTHIPCDYPLGNTRVVCNPRGYPWEGSSKGYCPQTVEI